MYGFKETLVIVMVVATCTFATRLFPFVIFSGKKEVSKSVKYLGNYLPPAVIAILVIYCFKGVDFTVVPNGLPEIIAAATVVLIHVWKRSTLISIGLGTVVYMFLIQSVFA